MKIILFGSGASHFDNGIIPYKPPLGCNLFNRLKTESQIILNLFNPKEQHEFELNNDFENGMKNLLT